MEPLEDTAASDVSLLRARLAEDGYALVRGLLPVDVLAVLHREITQILADEGWLLDGSDSREAIAAPGVSARWPDPMYLRAYWRVFSLELFHQVPHARPLMDLFEAIFSAPVLVHPKSFPRLVLPRGNFAEDVSTRVHQDFVYTQGTMETYTAWIPLSDCPMSSGGLQIAKRSHRRGVLPFQPSGITYGFEVADSLDGSWAGGDMRRGDVLIFHSLTAHRAAPNLSGRVRLSMDCRFQDARAPIAANNLALNENGMTWPLLYSGWTSDALHYYWKSEGLTTVPYDPAYAAERDAAAIKLGQRGDRRAIPTLHFIEKTTRDPGLRAQVQELLANLAGK